MATLDTQFYCKHKRDLIIDFMITDGF